MLTKKTDPRPAATPEAGHLVSAGIRAMVPGWIVEMVEDRNADALAVVCALVLCDDEERERVAMAARTRSV